MQTISHKSLVDYLEELGNRSTHINNVYLWNNKEIKGRMRSGVAPTLLTIDNPTLTETGRDELTVNEVYTCALNFLGKKDTPTVKTDAYANQREVQHFCMDLSLKFKAKIKHDASQPFLADGVTKNWLYARLQTGSFQHFAINNVFTDNLFGYRLQFQIKLKPSCHVNPADWLLNT